MKDMNTAKKEKAIQLLKEMFSLRYILRLDIS